ncbi:MAG: hypothetical protein KF773_24460 [Deltaproteobacteria bacterium]|nr:hypothetical protein [Deltaproteobacteria bacterium]MCW5804641.1 hypothetical protein [Deltaproteobacteria bacterium]
MTALLEAELDTYEKLEVLRQLRVAGAPCSRAQLRDALRLDRDVLDEAIQELAQAGFLVAGDPVAPAARAAEPAVASALDLYEAEKAAVLAVLSRGAMRRIRERAARTFVERRGPRDDDT